MEFSFTEQKALNTGKDNLFLLFYFKRIPVKKFSYLSSKRIHQSSTHPQLPSLSFFFISNPAAPNTLYNNYQFFIIILFASSPFSIIHKTSWYGANNKPKRKICGCRDLNPGLSRGRALCYQTTPHPLILYIAIYIKYFMVTFSNFPIFQCQIFCSTHLHIFSHFSCTATGVQLLLLLQNSAYP